VDLVLQVPTAAQAEQQLVQSPRLLLCHILPVGLAGQAAKAATLAAQVGQQEPEEQQRPGCLPFHKYTQYRLRKQQHQQHLPLAEQQAATQDRAAAAEPARAGWLAGAAEAGLVVAAYCAFLRARSPEDLALPLAASPQMPATAAMGSPLLTPTVAVVVARAAPAVDGSRSIIAI
jgi:hypothetical protein